MVYVIAKDGTLYSVDANYIQWGATKHDFYTGDPDKGGNYRGSAPKDSPYVGFNRPEVISRGVNSIATAKAAFEISANMIDSPEFRSNSWQSREHLRTLKKALEDFDLRIMTFKG